MQDALTLIPATAVLVEIGNEGHDLARGKFDIARLVVEPFLRLMRDSRVAPL